MRRTNSTELKFEEDGTTIAAINLGSDYCAEHEWGIKGIRRSFDINSGTDAPFHDWWNEVPKKQPKLIGIKKREINKVPESFVFGKGKFKINDKDVWYIGKCTRNWSKDDSPYELNDQYIKDSERGVSEGKTVAFWDENNFLIVSPTDLTPLKEAFEKNDIAIWLGGGGPFENAGLVVAKISSLDKDFIDDMATNDIENWKLKREAVDTGIYKKIEKSGKRFMALSPRRNDDGTIRFWLNPHDQQTHQYGWYEIKELEQWVKDKGPIMEMT